MTDNLTDPRWLQIKGLYESLHESHLKTNSIVQSIDAWATKFVEEHRTLQDGEVVEAWQLSYKAGAEPEFCENVIVENPKLMLIPGVWKTNEYIKNPSRLVADAFTILYTCYQIKKDGTKSSRKFYYRNISTVKNKGEYFLVKKQKPIEP